MDIFACILQFISQKPYILYKTEVISGNRDKERHLFQVHVTVHH